MLPEHSVKPVFPRYMRWIIFPLGLLVGALNGFFGAGGGMVAVPMLRGMSLNGKQSHATAMTVIFPLSIVSGVLYLHAGSFSLRDALPFLPGGLLGAIVGALLLPRIQTIWLRRIFGLVILFSAARLLLQ